MKWDYWDLRLASQSITFWLGSLVHQGFLAKPLRTDLLVCSIRCVSDMFFFYVSMFVNDVLTQMC